MKLKIRTKISSKRLEEWEGQNCRKKTDTRKKEVEIDERK